MATLRVRSAETWLAVRRVEGSDPPVVFVSALGETQQAWDPVLGAMRCGAASYTYDRPGVGDSDPLPPGAGATGFGYAADQLAELVTAMGVNTPHVVVGQSIGALVAMLYRARRSTEVAGLVSLESSFPRLQMDVVDGAVMRDAGGSGVVFDFHEKIDEIFEVPVSVPSVVVAASIGRWVKTVQRYPRDFQPFTGEVIDERWQEWQREIAVRLGAERLIAATGGHRVHIENPALVARAIDAVVEAVRAGSSVQLNAEEVVRAGGFLSPP